MYIDSDSLQFMILVGKPIPNKVIKLVHFGVLCQADPGSTQPDRDWSLLSSRVYKANLKKKNTYALPARQIVSKTVLLMFVSPQA